MESGGRESRKQTFYFCIKPECHLFPLPATAITHLPLSYSLPLGGEGWGRGLFQCPLNFVHHTPHVFIEHLIAKPNDSKSARSEPNGSARVMNLALLLGVLRPIKLDDQAAQMQTKSTMYAPMAACRRNFTPSLAARRKCHKRFSAGVASLRSWRAKSRWSWLRYMKPPPQPSPQGGGSRKGHAIGSSQARKPERICDWFPAKWSRKGRVIGSTKGSRKGRGRGSGKMEPERTCGWFPAKRESERTCDPVDATTLRPSPFPRCVSP